MSPDFSLFSFGIHLLHSPLWKPETKIKKSTWVLLRASFTTPTNPQSLTLLVENFKAPISHANLCRQCCREGLSPSSFFLLLLFWIKWKASIFSWFHHLNQLHAHLRLFFHFYLFICLLFFSSSQSRAMPTCLFRCGGELNYTIYKALNGHTLTTERRRCVSAVLFFKTQFRVFDFEEYNGQLYFVKEYLEKVNLFDKSLDTLAWKWEAFFLNTWSEMSLNVKSLACVIVLTGWW